jgi:exosortase A-associated hydrolase 2
MSRIEVAASQAPASPGRRSLPQAFFLDAPQGGQRFCLFHTPRPGAPERGRVLFCHPFAEELNTTRSTIARQARALADIGFSVLQIDLLGCGDSSGDFGEASWPAWLADLQLAHAWLSDQQPAQGPLWLWGLRAGALLASDLAAALPEPANLLLWQPFASGQQQLQQFLRLHSAGQWLASSQTDKKGQSDTPAQQLAEGQTVHIAGYPLNPLLAQGLATTQLQPPAQQPPGQLVWLELGTQTTLGPAAAKHLTAWHQAGWQVTGQAVATPAFWQTVDTAAAPDLIPATLAVLTTAPTQPATATVAPLP